MLPQSDQPFQPELSNDQQNDSSQDVSQGRRQSFRLETMLQAKNRLEKFMGELGDECRTPVNFERYKGQLPNYKQLEHNPHQILRIVDGMIKKANLTNRIKKNWSKYDMFIMFWLIEKYNHRYSKRTSEYTDDDWKFISSMVPGKGPYSCMFKWFNLKFNVRGVKDTWQKEETDLLHEIVNERKNLGLENNKNHWSIVSQRLYLESTSEHRVFRTAKHCRERWNCSNPDIRKDLWSRKEDITLLRGYIQKGKKWAIISRELGTRTENAVKNRFQLLWKKMTSDMKKSGSHQSIKTFMLSYIQNLELDEIIVPHEAQPAQKENIEDQSKLHVSPQIKALETPERIEQTIIAQVNEKTPNSENTASNQAINHYQYMQPQYLHNSPYMPTVITVISSPIGLFQPQSFTHNGRIVRFCKMNEDLARKMVNMGKPLFPAVFEQSHIRALGQPGFPNQYNNQ